MMCLHLLKAALRTMLFMCPALVLSGGMAAANPFPPTVWTCYRNESFTVLATDKREEVGTRFLVRKSTPAIKADCIVEQRPSDRVIGVPADQDQMEAFFYIALVKPFLVLDSGTGPDRGLIIYDLRSGKQVLAEGYSTQGNCEPTQGCESDEFRIDETGVTFWREIADKPSPKNCPRYAELKNKISLAIEEKSLFNFAKMTITPLKARRCVTRQ